MVSRIGLLAVVALLLSGCGRSDSEIAQQRKALEDVLAQAPLPTGSTADRARARFDKGLSGLRRVRGRG